MYGLRKVMQQECERLQKLVELATQEIKGLPEGSIRISKSNNHVQYYFKSSNKENNNTNKNGSYLHRSDDGLAKQLAQRKYDERLLKLATKRLGQLKRILSDYHDDEIEELFYKGTKQRQNLVIPLEKTWEQELKDWIDLDYDAKLFYETSPEIYADKGHRVRSKSEKILADYFYRNNIPYHYEKPLYLAGYGIVYPDFTFYSKQHRQEIYWEHEGRMDDPEYASKAVNKIKTYEKNGIFVGERLIVTQETSGIVLQSSDIERKVKKFLLL